MNVNFISPFGELTLKRFPYLPQSKSQQNLQAWDGADTLLLEELQEHPLSHDQRVLILNDQFGALSVALRDFSPVVQSDSFLSKSAIEQNIRENSADEAHSIRFIPSTEALDEHYDVVLIRVPKSLHYLEHQLVQLSSCISESTRIIATAMAKNLSHNVRTLFENILGPSKQSLAKRKARLIHCVPDTKCWKPNTSQPVRSFTVDGLSFSTQANVFANGKLDPGTRVFLDHIKQLPQAESVLDLACGSGVMGIFSAKQSRANELYFCDESYMATASATVNAQALCPELRIANITSHSIPNDCPQVELIVCNPPFHQQQATTRDIALQMFRDANRHLLRGGQFWVIANRHLDYHRDLKKLFGNCSVRSRHPKYVVLQCTKLER